MVVTTFKGPGIGLGFGVGCGFGVGWGFGGMPMNVLGLGFGGGCGVGLGLGWGFGNAYGCQYRSSRVQFQGIEYRLWLFRQGLLKNLVLMASIAAIMQLVQGMLPLSL